MQLSKPGYYADFVVYPLLILGLLAVQLAEAKSWRPFGFVFLCLLGFAAWTLFEYLLHRYVLHRVPILHDMHEAHHANPSAFVGTPSWASFLMFFVGALLPLSFAIGFTYASPVTIGLMLGYLCYVVVHHVTHHWRLAPEFTALPFQASTRAASLRQDARQFRRHHLVLGRRVRHEPRSEITARALILDARSRPFLRIGRERDGRIEHRMTEGTYRLRAA